MMNRATTMILVAGALAGATVPAAGALACGPYGPPPEAPRPERAQTWACQSPPRVGASGEEVVDVMRLKTRGGEDTMWGFLIATVPAKDADARTLDGPSNDFGLPSWSPDTLHIQMYGRSVVLVPSLWNPSAVNAELRSEYGETTVVNTFDCVRVG
jgi:hypothetical protein